MPKNAPRAPKSHWGVPSPEKAGTNNDAFARRDTLGQQLALGRVVEETQLDEPFDAGAGAEDDAFDTPRDPPSPLLRSTVG